MTVCFYGYNSSQKYLTLPQSCLVICKVGSSVKWEVMGCP